MIYKNKYLDGDELKDKAICKSLRKCADNYENGDILSVYDELYEIMEAIDYFCKRQNELNLG